MTGRVRLWFIAAVIFVLINIGGGIFALLGGEWSHALGHLLLLFLGVWGAARASRPTAAAQGALADDAELRLRQLQQSIDAVAIEVERIGEAQRFIAKTAAERAKGNPPKPQP